MLADTELLVSLLFLLGMRGYGSGGEARECRDRRKRQTERSYQDPSGSGSDLKLSG